MSAIEAACAGLEPSEALAETGATGAVFGPQMRPTDRQRTEVRRDPRIARAWFHNKPWFAKPWFRKPSWHKEPVRRPILVLAGVQLSNYRCLPELRKPTGSYIAPMERSDPTSR